jgi:hypothetical protein
MAMATAGAVVESASARFCSSSFCFGSSRQDRRGIMGGNMEPCAGTALFFVVAMSAFAFVMAFREIVVYFAEKKDKPPFDDEDFY